MAPPFPSLQVFVVNKIPILSSAFLMATVAPVVSQEPVQVPHEQRYAMSWVEAPTNASDVLRVVSGRFGNDSQEDVAVISGPEGSAEVWYRPNPRRFHAGYSVTTGIADIAVLANATADQRDGLLVLDSTGLRLFTATAQQLVDSQINVAGDWTGATRVWSAINDTGENVVFGFHPPTASILRVKWTGTTFVSMSALASILDLTDIWEMDFDGDGDSEIVLWNGRYIVFAHWDGTPIASLDTVFVPGDDPSPAGTKRLAAIAKADAATGERDLALVYIWSSVASQHFLISFHSGYGHWMPLGTSVKSECVVTSDHDGDGLQDVVLARSDASSLHLLMRSTGNTPFQTQTSPGDEISLVSGNLIPTEGIDALLAQDFDWDEDSDYMAFQRDNSYIQYFFNETISGHRPNAEETLVDVSSLVENGTQSLLQMDVGMPDAWATMTPPPGENLYVRVDGWLQPSGTQALITNRHLLVTKLIEQPGSGSVPIDLDFDATGLGHDYVLHLHVGFTFQSSAAEMTHRFPTILHYYTRDDFQTGVEQTWENLYLTTLEERVGTSTQLPLAGDGNVTGNGGSNPPPDPPEPIDDTGGE